MTEEEFYALPPEQQMALMQQREQSQEMKVDYGAMKTPYGVSSDRKSAPPPQQGRQQQSLPPRQGGGTSNPGMNTLTKQFGKKLGAAPASGAGSALTATEAAAFTPAYAPTSLAVGGSTANAGVGTALAGNVGSGAAGTAAPAASGGGSMLASAGPWAALAAAIAINENDAREHGRRDEDSGSYATDLLSGAVFEQDAAEWGDKIGGPLGEATEFMGEMGNPEGILKNMELLFRPDELWDKWF